MIPILSSVGHALGMNGQQAPPTPLGQATMAQAPQAPQAPQQAQAPSRDAYQSQLLLGIGSGLLSGNGASGLAQAAQNASGIVGNEQKRKDALGLLDLKKQKLMADIQRGLRPQIVRLGNGTSMAILSDGTQIPITDDEVRQMGLDKDASVIAKNEASTNKTVADTGKKTYQKVGEKAGMIVMVNKNDPNDRIMVTPKEYTDRYDQEVEDKRENATVQLKNKIDLTPPTVAERKLDDEAKGAVSGIQSKLDEIKDLKDFADKFEPGIGSQLAGSSFGGTVAALASGKSASAAGAAQYQQKVKAVINNSWLELSQFLKGAFSDAEGRKLASSLPDPQADYKSVIKPWIEKVETYLKTGLERQSANAANDTTAQKNRALGKDSPVAPKGSEGSPPASMLKEGVPTKFKNGMGSWMLKDGKPVKVD